MFLSPFLFSPVYHNFYLSEKVSGTIKADSLNLNPPLSFGVRDLLLEYLKYICFVSTVYSENLCSD